MDCSPPDSSVHEIFQARILEQVAISSSRGSFLPRDLTCVSSDFCIAVDSLLSHQGSLDPCICMVESLHCWPETTTTLLIGYTPIQNKKFEIWKKKKKKRAAGSSGYRLLGQCPMSCPPRPTKSCLVCGQKLHSEWTPSSLAGYHSDRRKSKQVNSGGRFAFFLAVVEGLNNSKKTLYLGFYRLTGRGQWPGHMARQRAMESWPVNRMTIWGA